MQFRPDKIAIQRSIDALQLSADKPYYEGDEWLETNALGGWAGSSITGCNTRRYHGLLVAATRPPTERMVLLSKLDETVVVNDERIELATNLYDNDVIHPRGYQYLSSFTRKLFPEWIYEIGDLKISKTVTMVNGENTTLILYKVIQAPTAFTLELLPLIAARGYHSLPHSNINISPYVEFADGTFKNQPYDHSPPIFIHVPNSTYHHQPFWFNKFIYVVEKFRGLDFEEDLFSHGIISVQLSEGDELIVMISTEDTSGKNARELFEREKLWRLQLIDHSDGSGIANQLTLAGDQFIVKRDEDLRTIIAGYHWFTDWGRDTMISLPGFCLTTGRYEDAKKILTTFANNVNRGMLPTRFPDGDKAPDYNNVDSTLWYFNAVYEYFLYTNDTSFILKKILPVLKECIDWHFKGTRYNIHVDTDGLLYAGEEGQQLTWMDAKIGDWVVTPRMGKPVEIQALWYNALKIFAELLSLNDQLHDAEMVTLSANTARESFLTKFWFASGNYLYDLIDEHGTPDPSLRPNQILAASLPFPLINDEQTCAILKTIEKKLYTPVGLRSLSPDDPAYVGEYSGDVNKRDSCYHQGTVWSWWLGPYIDAIMYVPDYMGPDGLSGKEKANKIIENFTYHLGEACIGSVSEIFDGDAPHYPRGCVAQAWNVAELLRVIKQHKLGERSEVCRSSVNKIYFSRF